MKRHTSTSSLDELLSLHCMQEIEFQPSNNSSLATASLNNVKTKPKTGHRHYKSKFEHRHRSRKKHKSKTKSMKALITQELHVERQEFGCVINLNTTLCDHSYKDNWQGKESPSTVRAEKLFERPVPHCMRQVCHKPRHYQTRCIRHSHEQRDNHKRSSGLSRTHRCVQRSQHIQKKSTHTYSRHVNKHSKTVKQKYYQSKPVSSALEAQYDDISNKSLDIYLEIPTSYKNVLKTSKDELEQSKLDTLIKRAKERERKLVQQSRNVHPHTSTYTEASPEEFMSCSELEASLHSRSTLVLDQIHRDYHEDSQLETENLQTIDYANYKIKTEPRESKPLILELTHKGYSPSIGLYTCRKYAPSSIRNELLKPPYNALNCKEAPAMDIDAYSPTQSPDLRTWFEELPGKREIKLETYS